MRHNMNTQPTRTDDILLAISTMLVVFSAMLDPRITVVLALVVIIVWVLYKLASEFRNGSDNP